MEEAISKDENDDRARKVQERHDHFAESKIAEGDATAEERDRDPRQMNSDEPKPVNEGGAEDAAPPGASSWGPRDSSLRGRRL